MFRKALLAVVCTSPLLWASPVAAAAITFDPDGPGGSAGKSIDLFTAAPGNVISIGGGGASGQAVGSSVTSLYQANLNTASNGGTTIYAPPLNMPNASFVAGIPEVIISATPGNIVFDFNSAAAAAGPTAANFFYMYMGATGNVTPPSGEVGNNNLDGACFTCGTRIVEGVFVDDAFFANSFTLDLNNTPTLLDQFNSDNYGGQQSIAGTGSLNAHILITYVDPNFFPGLSSGQVLTWTASTDTVLPYTHVDPSACFSLTGSTGAVRTGSANSAASCTYLGAGNPNVGRAPGTLGPICTAPGVPVGCDPGVANGESTDVVLESVGRFSFVTETAVPEPASLTLVGIGLLAAARRRLKKVSK